ncbi:MAG: isochorismatase family protein [Thermoplasmataceae archaeon]|jgi:nicotinamidase-related amidase|nr:cysteine hydrolase [Candidatus Thermoplasmatota archaeon]
MDELERSRLDPIPDPDEVSVIFINYTIENFADSFSKMENVTAMDYLVPKIEETGIESQYVFTSSGGLGLKESVINYLSHKNERRRRNMAPQSQMDARFISEFSNYLPEQNSPIFLSKISDIFGSKELSEKLKNSGRDYIFLCGYFVEREIYHNVITCLDNGFFPFVISDAVSTYSERVFYGSLDLLSQIAEVIDTRDLMKKWG